MNEPPDNAADVGPHGADTGGAAARTEAERRRRAGVYDDTLVAGITRPLNIDPDPDFPEGEAWYLAEAGASISADPPARPAGEGLIGSARIAARRVTRRTLRSYIEPVLERVTSHNRSVLRILADHERRLAALEQRPGEATENLDDR